MADLRGTGDARGERGPYLRQQEEQDRWGAGDGQDSFLRPNRPGRPTYGHSSKPGQHGGRIPMCCSFWPLDAARD
jgi:hypothetical protein